MAAPSKKDQVIDLTRDSDEIIVDNAKVPLLRQYSTWIQENHTVKINFGEVAQQPDGIHRWIGFIGEEEQRKKAKDYVRSLCSATSEVKMKYPVDLHALLTNTTVRSRLEDHSKAVLKFGEPGEVTILGLDPLPVTLAMSALEDVINKHIDGLDFNQDKEESKSGRKSEASNRLDIELRRLSSEEGHKILEDDYSSTNDAVKRTILSWMMEGDEDAVDSIPTQKMEMGMTVQQLEQIQLGRGISPASSAHSCSSSMEEASELSSDTPSPKTTESGMKIQESELYEFATNMGYSDEDIEKVFKEHGNNLPASQFINKLVDNAKRKTQSNPAVAVPNSSLPKPPSSDELQSSPALRPKLLDHKELKLSKHLDGYLEERRKHHVEESTSTNIEDLKKNNHKRQQLLRDAMERQESEKNARQAASGGVTKNSADGEDVMVTGESVITTQKRNYSSNSPQPRGKKKNRNQNPLEDARDTSTNLGADLNVPLQHHYVHPIDAVTGIPQPLVQPPPVDQGARPKMVKSSNLRYIVIDGSNIAMSHGNGRVFSCKGIQICVDYFRRRGHTEITAFVPQWRTREATPHNPISHQHLLDELRDQSFLVYTPARRVPGKNIVCYDDKFILRLAEETGGIMVSNDNYRDLWQEKQEWREIIEKRLTGFSFVGDIFMLPDDPLGRHGPDLDEFLQKRTQQRVAGSRGYMGQPQAPRPLPIVQHHYPPVIDPRIHSQAGPSQQPHYPLPQPHVSFPRPFPSSATPGMARDQELLAGPAQANPNQQNRPNHDWHQVPQRHKPRVNQRPGASHQNSGGNGKNRGKGRTPDETHQLYEQLQAVFEGNERRIIEVLEANPSVKDIDNVSSLILDGM